MEEDKIEKAATKTENKTRTTHTKSSKGTEVKESVKESAKKAPAKKETDEREKKQPIIPKDIDPHMYVTVKNGFQGTLIYKSSKTGERFIWDEFGDEQEMELIELKTAKNSSKKFFENNWFMFDEPWVVEYLGLTKYYKNAIPLEDFDSIFTKSPSEIKEQIALLSDGQKHSVAYRARQLVANEEIDSIKVIEALEKALGVELVIR